MSFFQIYELVFPIYGITAAFAVIAITAVISAVVFAHAFICGCKWGWHLAEWVEHSDSLCTRILKKCI